MTPLETLIAIQILGNALLWPLVYLTALWATKDPGNTKAYRAAVFTFGVAASFTGYGMALVLEAMQ